MFLAEENEPERRDFLIIDIDGSGNVMAENDAVESVEVIGIRPILGEELKASEGARTGDIEVFAPRAERRVLTEEPKIEGDLETEELAGMSRDPDENTEQDESGLSDNV